MQPRQFDINLMDPKIAQKIDQNTVWDSLFNEQIDQNSFAPFAKYSFQIRFICTRIETQINADKPKITTHFLH